MESHARLLDRLRSQHSQTMEMVWDRKPGWPLLHVSDNVESLLGFRPEELLDGGIPYRDLIHPDDLPRVDGEVDSFPRDSQWQSFTHQDYRLRTARGEWIWVEDQTLVVRDKAGRPERYVGIVHVVTRRHEAEAALARNRDRLALVLESTRLGLWDWNPQTDAVVFDERWAEMLGLKLEALGMTLEDWKSRVHPDDLAEALADIQAHLDGKAPFYENLHRMRHADGSWRYILDRGRVVERDREGRAIRFTGTHADLTALKEAELTARAALKGRNRLFSLVSHEMRTPLHGILGITDWLLRNPSAENLTERLEAIQEAGRHLHRVVSDILDLAKFEEGKLSLQPEIFDLNEVLQSVFDLFEARSWEKRLAFQFHPAPQGSNFVRTDRHRLIQIITNLVSNAIKYTDRGRVALEATAVPGGPLQIHVRDTGVGIRDPERIFRAFEQEGTADSQILGTGLGLSICRRLADLLELSLRVESTPGEGTVFTVAIPAAQRVAAPETEPASPPPTADQSLPAEMRRILVADDKKVNRIVARAMLEDLGAEVVEAVNGREAVEQALAARFDLILMDLHMPEMDGLEATTEIRRRTGPACPLVVGLTADAFPEVLQACRRAGIEKVITKPFGRQDLLEVIPSRRPRI